MKTNLYTVRVAIDGAQFLVGNFAGKWRASNWAHRVTNTLWNSTAKIEPGAHSLLGPRDFESLYPAFGRLKPFTQ